MTHGFLECGGRSHRFRMFMAKLCLRHTKAVAAATALQTNSPWKGEKAKTGGTQLLAFSPL
jgi:hypothetical protein